MSDTWKDQIHRSSYLKDFWRHREGRLRHPVFGEKPDDSLYYCEKCGEMTLKPVISIVNGEVEYILCPKCFSEMTSSELKKWIKLKNGKK